MMVDSSFSRLSLKRPEALKRLEISRDKREWLSETDLDHLPPLSPVPQSPSSPRKDQFRRLHNPRPPTPSPSSRRVENYFSGKPRNIGPLSSGNSTNRLSLNLDLSPLREGSVTLDRFKQENSFERPGMADSPRLCVRSLPTSPVLTRASRPRRPMRRIKSDSEHDEFTKEDRIIQWIQDVQEKGKDESVCIDVEDLSEFSSTASTSDSSELELGSSPSLPAIQEHSVYKSPPNQS